VVESIETSFNSSVNGKIELGSQELDFELSNIFGTIAKVYSSLTQIRW